jgi:hypothetical protein
MHGDDPAPMKTGINPSGEDHNIILFGLGGVRLWAGRNTFNFRFLHVKSLRPIFKPVATADRVPQ